MVQTNRRYSVIAAAVWGFVANLNDDNSSSSVIFKVCCKQPVLLTELWKVDIQFKIFEQMNAPIDKTGQALAAAGFGRTHRGPYRGWARLESELSPQNSQCIQIHDYCNPGTWLQWIHPGGLVKAMSERHQDKLLAYPQQCQHKGNLRTHTTGER